MNVDPLFRSLVVGVVPAPRPAQAQAFTKEELQRTFFDVTKAYAFSQFAFLPIDGGAQLVNGPDDRILIQPGLIQILTPVELTAERARQKAVDLLRIMSTRLAIDGFQQVGLKVVAHVLAPGSTPDARQFVSHRLMSGDRADELGPTFFGGGVKYRSISERMEQNLLVEPLIADTDNKHLWIDYDVQRAEPADDTEAVGAWIDEAFDFVRGPVMTILEV